MRGAYVEQDGKFVLDITEPDAHPAVQGKVRKTNELLGETKNERAKRKELEDKLKAYEAEREQRDLESKGLVEEKKKWDEQIFKPKVTELETELTKLREENSAYKLVTPIKDLLHKAGFIDVDDAWALLGPHFALDDKNGPIVKDDPTKPIEKHVADLAVQKPWMVRGTEARGGAAAGNRGASSPGKVTDPRQWTPQERATYIEEHGLTKLQDAITNAIRADKKAA